MKNLIILLFTVASFSGFSQNGYSLEFETTIIMSHDSTVGLIPANTTRVKQYIVPAGMVLKINSGILADYYGNGGNIQGSELKIGNQVINPPFLTYGTSASVVAQYSIVIGGGFDGVQPIWANEGTIVKLTYKSGLFGGSTSIRNCWISGVLFRKIPN